MTPFTDLFFKKHPIFTLANDVNALCHNFFSSLNINFFDYVRYYSDHSYVGLVSDGAWVENFFKNNFKVGSTLKNSGVHLWQSYRSNLLIETARNDYQHDHGISIFNQGHGYIEYFEFAAPSNNTAILSTYLNNIQLFKNFGHWFLYTAKKLLDQVEKSPIIIPSNMQGNLVENPSTNSINFTNATFKNISPREKQCIEDYLLGNTAKETARKLNLSHRTVEDYLATAKKKLGIHTKRELIKIFNNSWLTQNDRL